MCVQDTAKGIMEMVWNVSYVLVKWQNCVSVLTGNNTLRDSFTKQGKLVREHNSKRAPIGMEIDVGDLQTD